jgi:P-type Cu2+ transporter
VTCCDAAPADPRSLEQTADQDRLVASSSMQDDGSYRTEFVVPDMHCIACIRTIEHALADVAGVRSVRANLSRKCVAVTWLPVDGNVPALEDAFAATGFAHSLFDPAQEPAETGDTNARQLLLGMAVAGFAAANIMLLSVSVWSGADAETGQLFHLISGLIAAPAIFFAGRRFFSSALTALSARRLNMDVPISLAVLLAFAMSLYEALRGGEAVYFDASLTLLFFLLIGRYLDHMMRDRARGAAMRLGRLEPRGAMAIDGDGPPRYTPLEAIEPGMCLRVAAGERVPVDGRILSGTSEIDRSLVTGEAMPVAVNPGAEIEAGTLNLTGALDLIALRDARHSFLADVMRMMEAAESGRGTYVRIADRMAAIYAPAVHILALAAFLVWMVLSSGDWRMSLFVAISVLIVTCPCALGLAVPVVHVIGAARLFDSGILMRDGSALERLADAGTAMLDKTGTLTTGLPTVAMANFPDGRGAAMARALAMHSNHPASVALRSHIEEPPARIGEIVETPGYGISARCDGMKIRLGRAGWAGEIAFADAGRSEGLAFAVEGGAIVPITLVEQLRPDAVEAVSQLRAMDFDLEILSGDTAGQVGRIAREIGVTQWRGDLTPLQKVEAIRGRQGQGKKVLVVGDGLNDAAALAAGDVSFAPASASDAGRMAADFVFTRQSLAAIPFAVRIARRAAGLVRQNFFLAILYNCIAVPLAMAGLVSPLVAAIAMSASSVVVVANSMRLNFGTRLAGEAEAREPSRSAESLSQLATVNPTVRS